MVYIAQNTTYEFPTTLADRWSPDDVARDKDLGGPAKYGRLHMRENRADLFEGWLSPSPISEYVKSIDTNVLIYPTKGREHPGRSYSDIRLADADGYVNFRDIGKLVSIGFDTERHITEFIKSDVGQELAEKFPELLSKAGDIDYIAIEGKGGFIYGVAGRDSVIFYSSMDSFKKLEKYALSEGIDTSDFMNRVMLEEILHVIRREHGSIKEEEAVRMQAIDIYTSLADKTKDSRQKGKYKDMVRHLERDLSNVKKVYGDYYSNLSGFVSMYKSGDLEGLVSELESIAVNKEGINTEKGVKAYVVEKLGEIEEAAENQDYDGGEVVEGEPSAVCADGEASTGGEAAEGGDGGESSGEGEE